MGLLTVGLLMTAYASYLFGLIPVIPYKAIPDLRLLVLLVSAAFIGFQAMAGSVRRRGMATFGAIAWIVTFHLEEATVRWVAPGPGSITGTRVGLVGTAGSILMLVALVLMHIEVERVRLRKDVLRRGATEEAADALVDGLAAEGRRQTWGLGAGVAALGVLIFVLEKIFGDTATGGTYAVVLGGALLLLLALYLLRLLPGAGAARAEPAEPARAAAEES